MIPTLQTERLLPRPFRLEDASAVRYAFEELGAGKLTSGHFRDNPASGRVLGKCGFRYT